MTIVKTQMRPGHFAYVCSKWCGKEVCALECQKRTEYFAKEDPRDTAKRLYGHPLDIDRVWQDRDDLHAAELSHKD